MQTFLEYAQRQDEALFGRKSTPQQPNVPPLLAYHISDVINSAMIQIGKMKRPNPHTPYGSNDGQYDAALKTQLRDHFYGIARQMIMTGDMNGIKDYFGFDLTRSREVGPGTFQRDIQQAARKVA
jgi:hypothetical protein